MARISIKSFLASYVIDFALEELGTDDLSEAVNQIILDHKRHRCSGSPPGAAIASTPVQREPSDLLKELEALPGLSS